MTLEELEREGIIAGLSLDQLSELTWGEVLLAVEAARERQRRLEKSLALIAHAQAALTAQALAGGQLPEPYEVFPFWTEEEVRAQRVEKVRRVMERYASEGKGGRNRA